MYICHWYEVAAYEFFMYSVTVTYKIISLHRYTAVTICGTVYRSGKCWLLLNSPCNSMYPNLPTFGHLTHIVSLRGGGEHIIFVCDVVRAITFDSHFGAYVLEKKSDELCPRICFYVSSLKCHYVFSVSRINKDLCIKSKYDLSGYYL